jgi:acyl-CoA thioesterase-1
LSSLPTTSIASASNKTVLVVGDSLSAEYGIARQQGWVALLQKTLEEKAPGTKVVNASISGDTTSGGLSRLPALLEKHQPAYVIIELGGNDALRGLPLSMTQSNLTRMTQMAQSIGAKVLLAGMQIPPNYGKEYSQAFQAIYPSVASQLGANLIPFFLEGVAQNMDLFQQDGIHPNEQAQPIMARTVWKYLEPLIQ